MPEESGRPLPAPASRAHLALQGSQGGHVLRGHAAGGAHAVGAGGEPPVEGIGVECALGVQNKYQLLHQQL